MSWNLVTFPTSAFRLAPPKAKNRNLLLHDLLVVFHYFKLVFQFLITHCWLRAKPASHLETLAPVSPNIQHIPELFSPRPCLVSQIVALLAVAARQPKVHQEYYCTRNLFIHAMSLKCSLLKCRLIIFDSNHLLVDDQE